MATVDLTGGSGIGWRGKDKHYVQKITRDFRSTTFTANDIYQVWDIPANTMIYSCRVVIEDAPTTGAGTIDVGITGVNADDLGDGVAYETEAATYTRVAETAWGDFDCTTADTLDILVKTVTTPGTGPLVSLYVECVDFN